MKLKHMLVRSVTNVLLCIKMRGLNKLHEYMAFA